MKIARGQVALGILAGGRASRLGGIDKALARHRGERLVDRCLAAMGDGYAPRLLRYNRTEGAGLPADMVLVADARRGSHGPLAGIEALLGACAAPWLLSLPVDVAEIPGDLFERLAAAGEGGGVRARDADGVQPLMALWRVESSRPVVSAALDAGERAVHRVQDALAFDSCDFAPARFGNFNTPAELSP